MIVRTLTAIQLGRVMRPAGSELDVDDAEGARMVATKVAVPMGGIVPAPTPEQAAFAALSAAKAAEHLTTVNNLDLLSSLAAMEQSRKGGVRKTVAEAFAARGAALTSGNTPPTPES